MTTIRAVSCRICPTWGGPNSWSFRQNYLGSGHGDSGEAVEAGGAADRWADAVIGRRTADRGVGTTGRRGSRAPSAPSPRRLTAAAADRHRLDIRAGDRRADRLLRRPTARKSRRLRPADTHRGDRQQQRQDPRRAVCAAGEPDCQPHGRGHQRSAGRGPQLVLRPGCGPDRRHRTAYHHGHPGAAPGQPARPATDHGSVGSDAEPAVHHCLRAVRPGRGRRDRTTRRTGDRRSRRTPRTPRPSLPRWPPTSITPHRVSAHRRRPSATGRTSDRTVSCESPLLAGPDAGRAARRSAQLRWPLDSRMTSWSWPPAGGCRWPDRSRSCWIRRCCTGTAPTTTGSRRTICRSGI